MLIRPNGRDRTDITKAPPQPKPAVEGAPALVCKTLPDGTDGRRLLSSQELFDLLKNPKMRDAISTLEKVMGCETAVRHMVRKQLKNEAVDRTALRVQMKALRLAQKKAQDKKKGLI